VPADTTPDRLPLGIHATGAILTMIAVIPIVLILRARYTTSEQPRIHVVPDMDFQWVNKGQTASGNYAERKGIFPHLKIPRFDKGQTPNIDSSAGQPIFADGRAMRKEVEGTVAVGSMADDAFKVFKTGDVYETGLPMELTEDLLNLGQHKFQVFCAPCHGMGGMGDGPVNQRALSLGEGTWVTAKNLQDAPAKAMTTGQLYEIITNGVSTMASYKAQLSPKERWAVVSYIRALQSTSDK
jgi:mono/diheme cytochrome c family protein